VAVVVMMMQLTKEIVFVFGCHLAVLTFLMAGRRLFLREEHILEKNPKR
jgi:hypothetical protein